MTASNLVFFGDSLTDNGNGPANGYTLGYPYWDNRVSNDKTYAEYVGGLLGLADGSVLNKALNGARAIGNVIPGTLRTFASQVESYVAGLGGAKAAAGTEASIYIGTVDYLVFPVESPQAAIAAKITEVIGAISAGAAKLAANGVSKIYLYTLPGIAATPNSLILTPDQVAKSVAIIEAHNAALAGLADTLTNSGVKSQIVDFYRLVQEFAADKETFGFDHVQDPLTDIYYLNHDNYAVQDSYAFFDGGSVHPTRAGHKVEAAFAAAAMAADDVRLSNGGDDVIRSGERGWRGDGVSSLIFTGLGNDRVSAGRGNDVVLAGQGADDVSGGRGNDFVSGGGGDDDVSGDSGSDAVAGNRGNDNVRGNDGDDILMAGGGRDRLSGGSGNDRLFFDELQGIVSGSQAIGGHGVDTLSLHISKATFDSAAFAQFMATVADQLGGRRGGSFDVLGISASQIERVEVFVDRFVPQDTPEYYPNHDPNPGHFQPVLSFSAGALAPGYGAIGAALLNQADMWGMV